jgi:hypothetical protein
MFLLLLNVLFFTVAALVGDSAAAANTLARNDDGFEKYRTQVIKLVADISTATQCYTDYSNSFDGANPTFLDTLIDNCAKLYDEIHTDLGEAKRTASAPKFPREKLYKAQLPDILDERIDHEGEWTKDLVDKIHDLTEAASRGHDIAIQMDNDLKQLNATIFEQIVPQINKTIFEKAEVLIKYVGLSGIMQGKSAREARDSAEHALVNYLDQLKANDHTEIVDIVMKQVYSEQVTV